MIACARPTAKRYREAAMQVRGVALAVRESGRGQPLLWGHGLLGSMAQEDAAGLFDWEAMGRAVRLVRYDARGHGRSEASLDPADYRWPELARDLLALADATGAARPVLGGLSMGCATALHAAAAAPERALGLVLVAPPTAWSTRPRQARIYRTLAAVVERVGLGPFRLSSWLGRLFPGPDYLALLQRSVAQGLRRADWRAVVAALRGAAASDLPEPERLRAVAAPALILAWRRDPSHPLATAERLAELLPGAELRVAGSLDEIRGWSDAIRSFLQDVSPRGPACGTPHA
jgi:pimeloyl-ACP methyl ester carboxylesterase